MNFQAEINMDNEAFSDGPDELARLLGKIMNQVLQGKTHGVVMDTNGNRVGDWGIGR